MSMYAHSLRTTGGCITYLRSEDAARNPGAEMQVSATRVERGRHDAGCWVVGTGSGQASIASEDLLPYQPPLIRQWCTISSFH